MPSLPWRGRIAAAGFAATAAILLAACGSSGGGGGSAGGSPASGGSSSPPASGSKLLTITTGAAGTFQDDFNPFSPNVEDATNGMIYETLFFYDTAKAGSVSPWLATGYRWAKGGKALTVQLRHGVTWTDGKPFTSADVAFTFNLALKNAALNRFALPLQSVTTSGAYSVTINFKQPAYTDAYYALGRVDILPQHIWQSVKDPATFLNAHPVGTGAFVLSKFSGQVFTLTANPHYYLPGLPHFQTIRFLAFSGNTTSDAAIESGEVDWAGSFIPNIKQSYLAKDPKFAVSDIPLSTAFLVPNMTSGPTAKLAVRQAISAALDRTAISNTVYNGYAPPTNPEALITPNYNSVLDPSLSSASFGSPSAARAKAILAKAGIKTPLNLTVDMVNGYTDYLSDLQIMVQELKPAGINLTIAQPAFTQFTSIQDTGKFQLLMDNFGYTPTPWSYYYSILDSTITKPIGQVDTVGNFGRYKNAQVDSLLNQIADTTSASVQNPAFYKIENIFAQQLPLIPLFEQQDEIEFNGNTVANYPTVANAYGAPAVYIQPDMGWIAARLVPVK
jgi:peptide/nickel transport system substrate-binding protein